MERNLNKKLDEASNESKRRQQACIHADALIAHQNLQSSDKEKEIERRFVSGEISIDELERALKSLYPELEQGEQRFVTWEDYLYPGTSVLRNKLGLTTHAALHTAEADLSKMRLRRLHYSNPLELSFDSAHYMGLHGFVFGDIFGWAGKFRNVDMGKGTTTFCIKRYIPEYLTATLEKLAEEGQLLGTTRDEFCSRAAFYLCELNAVHPFREGNGRVQEEFIRELGEHAGYLLDWSQVTGQEIVKASIASFTTGEHSHFEVLLQRVVER